MNKKLKFTLIVIFLIFIFGILSNSCLGAAEQEASNNLGTSQSHIVISIYLSIFLFIIFLIAFYGELLKKLFKNQEKFVKIIIAIILGFVAFQITVPQFFKIINSVPAGEALPFYPFIMLSLVFSIAILIAYVDDIKHATFFSITSFIVIIFLYFGIIQQWDLFIWATASFTLASFVPAFMFNKLKSFSLEGIVILVGGCFVSAIFTSIFLIVVRLPDFQGYIPYIGARFINILWIAFVANFIVFSSVIIIHELLCYITKRKRVADPKIRYIKQEWSFQIKNAVKNIIFFIIGLIIIYILGIRYFNDITGLLSSQGSLLIVEVIGFPINILLINSVLLIIGVMIAYLDNIRSTIYFALGGGLGVLLYYSSAFKWDFLLFGIGLYICTFIVVAKLISETSWDEEKFTQIAYGSFIASVLSIFSAMALWYSQLPLSSYMSTDIIITGIVYWWFFFISSFIIFTIVVLSHEYLLYALNLQRVVDNNIVRYIRQNINIKNIGLMLIFALLGGIIFYYLYSGLALFPKLGTSLTGSLEYMILIISSIVFLIPALLGYFGKIRIASLFSFTGFIVLVLLVLTNTNLMENMRSDLFLLAIAFFTFASIIPALIIYKAKDIKEIPYKIGISSVASSIIIAFIPILYNASFESNRNNFVSFIIPEKIFNIAWISFVIMFFLFLGVFLVHEAVLYMINKKRIIINRMVQYVKASEAEKLIEAEKQRIAKLKLAKPSEPEKKGIVKVTKDKIRLQRCSICLGRIKPGSATIKCESCKKIYHGSCAVRVKTCPNCNEPLKDLKGKKNEQKKSSKS